MFKRSSIALVLVLAGHASADPKAPPAKDAKLEVKAPEPPKPPAELDVMAKSMVGTWKCTGTETAMDGTVTKTTGKVTVKLDLEKWWLNEVVELKNEKRGAYKTVAYSTFDPGSKKWRRISIDSMGYQHVGTSDGIKDGKLVWSLDFLGAMGAGQAKDTVDSSDAKAGVKFTGVMSVDKGKTWKPVSEMTCKK